MIAASNHKEQQKHNYLLEVLPNSFNIKSDRNHRLLRSWLGTPVPITKSLAITLERIGSSATVRKKHVKQHAELIRSSANADTFELLCCLGLGLASNLVDACDYAFGQCSLCL